MSDPIIAANNPEVLWLKAPMIRLELHWCNKKDTHRLSRAPTFEEIVARIDIGANWTCNAPKIPQQDLSLDVPRISR